jgi:hypothetical protein
VPWHQRLNGSRRRGSPETKLLRGIIVGGFAKRCARKLFLLASPRLRVVATTTRSSSPQCNAELCNDDAQMKRFNATLSCATVHRSGNASYLLRVVAAAWRVARRNREGTHAEATKQRRGASQRRHGSEMRAQRSADTAKSCSRERYARTLCPAPPIGSPVSFSFVA